MFSGVLALSDAGPAAPHSAYRTGRAFWSCTVISFSNFSERGKMLKGLLTHQKPYASCLCEYKWLL